MVELGGSWELEALEERGLAVGAGDSLAWGLGEQWLDSVPVSLEKIMRGHLLDLDCDFGSATAATGWAFVR